jgi:hypothetical protein
MQKSLLIESITFRRRKGLNKTGVGKRYSVLHPVVQLRTHFDKLVKDSENDSKQKDEKLNIDRFHQVNLKYDHQLFYGSSVVTEIIIGTF